jgi:hypothetical protein
VRNLLPPSSGHNSSTWCHKQAYRHALCLPHTNNSEVHYVCLIRERRLDNRDLSESETHATACPPQHKAVPFHDRVVFQAEGEINARESFYLLADGLGCD